MRALKFAVVAMGVLIVVGVATLAFLIVRRVAPGAPAGVAAATLDEPDGTGISGVALSGDRMVVRLRGGGPDRLVVLDVASGRVLARVGLH